MLLLPSDTQDFAYTVQFFRVQHGGTVKLKQATGETVILNVPSGGYVNTPTRRIFATGTSASGFQNDLFVDVNAPLDSNIVPYAPVGVPDAQFTGTPLSGDAPLTVDFTDESTGAITKRVFYPGDGTDPTAFLPPSYVYASGGTFSPSLQVIGPAGTSILTKSGYITVNSTSPPPPPGTYDGNPTHIEVNDDGNQIVFTFGGEILVVNTVTVTVGGGTPVIWNTSDGSGSSVAYVLPDFTPPIEDGQTVTVTYSGGSWTTNPPVGAPNDPVTNGPVINSSNVPVGSNNPTLLSAEVQANGTTILFTWDRPVEILSIDEGLTAIEIFINGEDNGSLNFNGGDGSTVTACTSGTLIISTDDVTFTVAAANWETSDYHIKTIAYTNQPMTNSSGVYDLRGALLKQGIAPNTFTSTYTGGGNDFLNATGPCFAIQQVGAFSATSVTTKVQESPNGSVWTDLATFTPVTAPNNMQVLGFTRTQRYLRCVATIVGGSPSIDISCILGQTNDVNYDFAASAVVGSTLMTQTLTANTNGVAVDLNAGTGRCFSIQSVGDFTGDELDSATQESADQSTWFMISGPAFDPVTGANAIQVVSFARSEQYVRIHADVSGGSIAIMVAGVVGQIN